MGPLISKSLPTSLETIKRLLDRAVPAVAKLCMPICDVRDVAHAHVKALTVPEAAGHRHVIVTASVWMRDVAMILHKEFKSLGYSVPTMNAPNFVVWLSAFMDKTYKLVLSRLSREYKFDTKRVRILIYPLFSSYSSFDSNISELVTVLCLDLYCHLLQLQLLCPTTTIYFGSKNVGH